MDNCLIERRIEQLLDDTERAGDNIKSMSTKLKNTKRVYEFTIDEATMEIELKKLDLDTKTKELNEYAKQGFDDYINRHRRPEY